VSCCFLFRSVIMYRPNFTKIFSLDPNCTLVLIDCTYRIFNTFSLLCATSCYPPNARSARRRWSKIRLLLLPCVKWHFEIRLLSEFDMPIRFIVLFFFVVDPRVFVLRVTLALILPLPASGNAVHPPRRSGVDICFVTPDQTINVTTVLYELRAGCLRTLPQEMDFGPCFRDCSNNIGPFCWLRLG
jgi:hypothetical protein